MDSAPVLAAELAADVHVSKGVALAGSLAVPAAGDADDAGTGRRPFSEHGRALAEVLGKRAKVGHPTHALVLDTSVQKPDVARSAFDRGRLGEWMQLAARHAPPSRAGKQARAVAGGLQDIYYHAVRRHLTEAFLATQGVAEAPLGSGSAAFGELAAGPEVASSKAKAQLLVAVKEAQDGAEGMVVISTLLEVQGPEVAGLPAVGGVLRLLLHRRHPLVEGMGGEWLPRGGDLLRIRGLRVPVAASRAGRGPLLLPLEVAILDFGGAANDPQPVACRAAVLGVARPLASGRGGQAACALPVAWECLDEEAPGRQPPAR